MRFSTLNLVSFLDDNLRNPLTVQKQLRLVQNMVEMAEVDDLSTPDEIEQQHSMDDLQAQGPPSVDQFHLYLRKRQSIRVHNSLSLQVINSESPYR